MIPREAVRRLRRAARLAVEGWRYPGEAPPPWSAAYFPRRDRFVEGALADPEVLHAFARGALPAGYGVGWDERCVEYPWCLGRLPAGDGPVLDAGGGLNHGFVLAHERLRGRPVHVVTLAPEAECHWRRGVSYLFHDLRDLPFRDGTYEVVACLSTLEHVGFDNTPYTGDPAHREDRPADAARVMRELARVLRPGGNLLLTVPFGRPARLGHFRQFDEAGLAEEIDSFGPAREVRRTFYRYGAGGWCAADAAACADAEYVAWLSRPPAEWPRPLRREPDGAVAARAVACVRIVR